MSNAITVLFYARKSRPNVLGQIPIHLRVTIDGERFQTATSRFVEADKWSQAAGKSLSSTKESKELNAFLDVMKAKAFDIQKKLITLGTSVNIENFERQWYGIEEKQRMLLEIFQHHNDQVKVLIGQQYSNAT